MINIKTIKNVFSLIIPIVFLYLLYQSHKIQANYMGEGNEPDFERYDDNKDNDVDDDNEDEFMYRKPKLSSIKNIKISLSTEDYDNVQLDEDNISYTQFKKLIKNKKFIKKYIISLKKSYDIKLKKYVKIYNDNIQLYEVEKGRQSEKNGMSRMNNININKLVLLLNELKDIISIIKVRRNNLVVEKIRADLKLCIEDKNYGIESLESREDVKDRICLQLFSFYKNPKTFTESFQNILIYGSSGIGKTKLAEVISFVYSNSGILVRDRISKVTKNEMTTAFVNESGNMTRELLIKTLDGVCFIDEAYELAPMNSLSTDHGREAITEMVNFMDKHIGLSIIIAAGYKEDMKNGILKSNEGMERRFPNIYDLKNYDLKTLTQILLKNLNSLDSQIIFTDTEGSLIYNILIYCEKQTKNIFNKQAGDMLNLSSHIMRSIYGSVNKDWINGNVDNNISMIINGFNRFIKSKDCQFSISDITIT